MVARLIRRSLERATKRRGDPRMGLRDLDADHLPIRLDAIPVIKMLTVHVEQTTD